MGGQPILVTTVNNNISAERNHYFNITINKNNIINRKSPYSTIKLNNQQLEVLLDTGATTNVIDFETYSRLNTKPMLDEWMKKRVKCLD